ncbi:MAG TPA: bifunctional 3'-5' exonuclease/DNA polymerase [Mycobacteriales bacterium]
MRWVVVPEGRTGGGRLRRVDEAGSPVGAVEKVDDLAAAVSRRESAERPRWVWSSHEDVYADLLAAGVAVERCVDLSLAESLLLAYDGRWGEPRSPAAAWARLAGLPVPADPPPRSRPAQHSLFDLGTDVPSGGAEAVERTVTVHADQLRRSAAVERPDLMRLLLAAESACGLVATEMTRAGVPWRVDLHDALLTRSLGPRPSAGLPPRKLADLADRVAEAFGARVNPDSPAEVVQAFARAGTPVAAARSSLLRKIDHPAVAPLLAYKELSRLHAANGWSWLDTWVRDGRFRPDWVVGGVVSGRWASRGGGALQIPQMLREAVVADPGHLLVVGDAAQLEPRILAALAGDERLAAAAASSDLYTALAADSFDGDRARAKVALLGTLYGATGGDAGPVLAVLRRRFPVAVGYVERAARDGEAGRLVRSRLGRTCPAPSLSWREAQEQASLPAAGEAEQARARQSARDRGRFTRNFVVQASAADWTAVLLAALRRRMRAAGLDDAELVFFQHDEVIAHCPEQSAPAVTAALEEAAAEASRLVFGDTPVRFPLHVAAVRCYADAK